MARLKIDITPSLQRLNLITKSLVNTKYSGNYASAFKGQGLEFNGYRYYTPSDDASLIDWKSSSRTRKLLVKEFVEERNLNVHFILDVSSKMILGSAKKLKCEYAAELVASFSNLILRAGDSVSLTMFSDKIVKKVMASNGMGHFYVISDSLSNLSFYGGGSNIKGALNYAFQFFDKNSLVILISDFIGINNFLEELKYISKKFDFIGIMLRDPIDMNLPKGGGQVFVEDPITNEKMLISPNKLHRLYANETKKEVSSLKKKFRDTGADFLYLSTDKPFIEDLIIFFERRNEAWK